MTDEKILTIKTIAKQLMAEKFTLGFRGYTQLDDAGVEKAAFQTVNIGSGR